MRERIVHLCDADENGSPETVHALTFDLDWQLFVTGQASAFNGTPKRWDDLLHSRRSHLGFWDLLGSTAMSPLLSGIATPPVGLSQAYQVRMRPCWPYADNVDYRLNWGDGTSTDFSGAASSFTAATHAWPALGTQVLRLTALRDAHGRQLNQATPRSVQVVKATWGSWLNRDDPSASGDWETLSDFVSSGQVCATPLAIECQTTTGTDWRNAGQVYACSLDADGGICRNADNPSGCLDYQVRFLCP